MASSALSKINRKLAERTAARRKQPRPPSARVTESPPDLHRQILHEVFVACQHYGFVKRSDITHFFPDVKGPRFAQVMNQVNEELRDVYGCELFEDDKQRGTFYLISILPVDPLDGNSSLDHFALGVCYAVLSVIFMANPESLRLSETAICKLLAALGLCDSESTNCLLMDIDLKTLLSGRFVREGWLRREAITNSNPVAYEYFWGARANRAIDKHEMLTFVSSVYGLREGALAWPEHITSITRDEVQLPDN
uniref:MAGE domain-containing protein n=1 Tax=Trichuris muris TaxID=70415 RepID=A0A5S6R1D6_TRIMR